MQELQYVVVQLERLCELGTQLLHLELNVEDLPVVEQIQDEQARIRSELQLQDGHLADIHVQQMIMKCIEIEKQVNAKLIEHRSEAAEQVKLTRQSKIAQKGYYTASIQANGYFIDRQK